MNSALMKPASCLLVAVAFALPATAALAQGDPAAGKAKSAPCAGCHGTDGKSIAPAYPHLAGQREQYLINALTAYREGQRQGDNAALMAPQAQPLSDEDIADLAAYYASLEP